MINRSKLLLASFLTIVVAGVGFGVRAGLLNEWKIAFGFTQTDIGTITARKSLSQERSEEPFRLGLEGVDTGAFSFFLSQPWSDWDGNGLTRFPLVAEEFGREPFVALKLAIEVG